MKKVRLISLILMLSLLTACFGGGGDKKDIAAEMPHYYVVDVDRGPVEPPFAGQRVLYLKPVKVTSQFRGKTIVFKVGTNEYQPQLLHELFSSPEEMFTEQLKRWLQKSGLFSHIVTDENAEADMVLETAITALYGEADEMKFPQSVLEMQIFLMSADKDISSPLMQTGLRLEVDIKETTPKQVVKGWKIGLEELLVTLEEDFRAYFLKRNP